MFCWPDPYGTVCYCWPNYGSDSCLYGLACSEIIELKTEAFNAFLLTGSLISLQPHPPQKVASVAFENPQLLQRSDVLIMFIYYYI